MCFIDRDDNPLIWDEPLDLDVDYSLPHETIVDDPLDKHIDLFPPHE